MHADYIANPLYDNNPFIEALPPMLSGRDLIHALAVIPPYSDSDRDRSTGERLQLLSSLYEFYQPLSMTIDLYCEIYTAMQHCYGQYSIQSEAAAMQNGYSLMHGNALAACSKIYLTISFTRRGSASAFSVSMALTCLSPMPALRLTVST